nr:Chain C, Pol FW9 peptide from Pol protein [Simian immunodeficiency virus]
FQWMGYELW